jgi:hypothetical protein
MQVMDSVLDQGHRASEPLRGGVAERLRPGLDVSMFALARPGGRSRLRLGVHGGAGPVRLHLYVDGELVESWTPAPQIFDFDLSALGDGRHAVTARAIDATGRWGGTSIILTQPSA